VGKILLAAGLALSVVLPAGAADKLPPAGAPIIAGGVQVTDAPVTNPQSAARMLDKGDPNQLVDAIVLLKDLPLAEVYKQTAATEGPAAAEKPDYQRAYSRQLLAAQAPVAAAAARYGIVTNHMTVVLNGLAMTSVHRRDLAALRQIPGVAHVSEGQNYKLDLYRSVPFIGADAVRLGMGLDGRGTRVAVIDTGIDYTHRNFGGPGTVAAFDYAVTQATAAPPIVYSGTVLFPTQKIPGGKDFVGDAWDGSTVPTRTVDLNPLDTPPDGGHGSHTAGIVGGFGVPNVSVDGSIPPNPTDFGGCTTPACADPPLYHGVAPAAQIYMYKVCSSHVNSCSGVAMMLGVEASVDPNGDGVITDHLDAANMSIGQPFGVGNDEILTAIDNAVAVGVAYAVSAGNSSDVPFITGAPATAAKALSVAASTASGHFNYALDISQPVTMTTNVVETVWQPWSAPLTPPTTGDLLDARVAFPSNAIGCDPFPAGSMTGKIAVIDRGTCAVSQKAQNAQAAGAVGMILVLLPGQELTSFSFGGGPPVTIPVVVARNSEMQPLRAYMVAGGTVTVTLGTSNPVPQDDVLAGFTSRGPALQEILKPDISAPGNDVVSTGYGTGTAGVSMSGTSMAAPHIAGSLALMKQAYPAWSAEDREAALVNGSKMGLYRTAVDRTNGITAPVSLAGAGRVALTTTVPLSTTVVGSDININFGIPVIAQTLNASRVVTVTNHSSVAKSYTLSASTQYTQPAALTNLSVTPANLNVAPGASATAMLNLTINPALLPSWGLSGTGGANSAALSAAEIGGYLFVNDAAANQQAHLAWYVLPRPASNTTAAPAGLSYGGGVVSDTITLTNTGAISGTTEVFYLAGRDPHENSATNPLLGGDRDDIEYTGVRSISASGPVTDSVQFAVHTYAPRVLQLEAEFDIGVDTNRDGTDDYVVFNADIGGFTTGTQNGVQGVWVLNLSTNNFDLVSYLDSNVKTSNLIMEVPVTALGMTPSQAFDFHVDSFNNANAPLISEEGNFDYHVDAAPDTGAYTFDPANPAFNASAWTVTLPPGSHTTLDITINQAAENRYHHGVLLIHRENMPTEPEATALDIGCDMHFSDVHTVDWFYGYVQYLYCGGAISGYSDTTFRPFNTVSRGQLSKIIVLAYGLPINTAGGPHFTDVDQANPFYTYIETLSNLGIISGYADHTFRPFALVTRGQTSKIVVNTAIYTNPTNWTLLTPGTPTFHDVPLGHPFYSFIETAYAHNVLGGYTCGSPGEPCPGLYFRPGNDATRAQASKIIYLAVTSPALK
jgi:subtilisin family serine protease